MQGAAEVESRNDINLPSEKNRAGFVRVRAKLTVFSHYTWFMLYLYGKTRKYTPFLIFY